MSKRPFLIDCFDEKLFVRAIAQTQQHIPIFRKAIEETQEKLNQHFIEGAAVETLILRRAELIDCLLSHAWNHLEWPDDNISLIAVGGYGRKELHPCSDIDLLILMKEDTIDIYQDSIERFITFLWDLKLDIGHSVRTIKECQSEARKDITIATNLMECRTVVGDPSIREAMSLEVGPNKIWPNQDFFQAKIDEQVARHRRFKNTEYQLEPNIKNSPGGLRDIQVISWIAKRHFEVNDINQLVGETFITEDEYRILQLGQHYLWHLRYGLHMVVGKPEDRLLFGHQRAIAELFGFKDTKESLAIEQLMQSYYRWSLSISELSEILLQNLDEAILRACEPIHITKLNSRFQIHNNHIEAVNDKVFINYPPALIEVFVLSGQNENIHGIRASTIRLIGQARTLINDAFRNNTIVKSLFIELFSSKNGPFTQLRQMTRYGILGLYLPEFGHIVGQMQHDLFHIYTVDAHTLFVIKNMQRFLHENAKEDFPVASHIARKLQRIDLLYISGLYHDIGKGRGGSHSSLGAVDAYAFCRNHNLSEADSNLVAWLVKRHLLMSTISQKKDIADPDVIIEFAREVGDLTHLDYLYALTVADINATNPNLWTNWRAQLMRQLYLNTKRAIRRGIENPIDKQNRITDNKNVAINRLVDKGFTEEQIRNIWGDAGDHYFLTENPNDIVWHTEGIANHDGENPLILIKDSNGSEYESATQILIYSEDSDNLFAAVAFALDQVGLNIVDARIFSSESGNTIDTFYVLDENGKPIGDNSDLHQTIKHTIKKEISTLENYGRVIKKRIHRRLKHFSMPTRTTMTIDTENSCSILEVITPDRPGLLAQIGRTFVEFNILLISAKITTLGERVEDVFFLSDKDHKPITDPILCEELQNEICRKIDKQTSDE